jgi:hypothetical protein
MTGHMNNMYTYPIYQGDDPKINISPEVIEASKAARAKEAAADAKGSLAQMRGHVDPSF